MPSTRRPPAAAPPAPPARALLAAFDPHLTLPVLHITWRPIPRVAELRANALLLYCPDARRDPASAAVHVALADNTPIKQVSPFAVRVSKHTLRFYAAADATSFLLALRASISARSRARKLASAPPQQPPLLSEHVEDVPEPPSPVRAYELATLSSSFVASVTLTQTPDGKLRVHKSVPKSEALAPARLPHTIAERAALARLTAAASPFYPRLHAAVETETHLRLETEYASRASLRTVLDSHPSGLPTSVVRQLAAELVLAVSDLHALDLLSRAVRTENVLLSDGGHVKLTGLGLSARVVLPHADALSRLADDGCLSDASGCFSAASTASSAPSAGRAPGHRRSCSASSDPPASIGSLLSDLSSETDADSDEGPASICLPATSATCDGPQKRTRGGEQGRPPLARAQAFVGARHYMAPEMLRAGHGGSRSYGAKADVWALGVTLFELATGRHAFADAITAAGEDGDASGLYAAIAYRNVDLRPVADPLLRDLLSKMLCRDEGKRPELRELASHAFFERVQWARLRLDASLDAPVDDVVAVAPRRFETLPVVSETTGRVSVDRPARRRGAGSTDSDEELLGFGFFMTECAV